MNKNEDVSGSRNIYLLKTQPYAWGNTDLSGFKIAEEVVKKIVSESLLGDNSDYADACEDELETMKNSFVKIKEKVDAIGVGEFDTSCILDWDYNFYCTIVDLTFNFPKNYTSSVEMGHM